MMKSLLRALATWLGLRCALNACPWRIDDKIAVKDHVFERCAICQDLRWRKA